MSKFEKKLKILKKKFQLKKIFLPDNSKKNSFENYVKNTEKNLD